MRVAISAYVSAPNTANSEPSTQARIRSVGDGSAAAIGPVVRKIPEPMIPPMTRSVAANGPIARSSVAMR